MILHMDCVILFKRIKMNTISVKIVYNFQSSSAEEGENVKKANRKLKDANSK